MVSRWKDQGGQHLAIFPSMIFLESQGIQPCIHYAHLFSYEGRNNLLENLQGTFLICSFLILLREYILPIRASLGHLFAPSLLFLPSLSTTVGLKPIYEVPEGDAAAFLLFENIVF